MSEMLSQEEIDALLRGDGAAAPQDNSSSQADQSNALTSEEIDALGEIGNISMGTSATTLFTLLNNKVNITTPKVSVVTWDELSGEYTTPYVAVQVQYKEGLQGSNLLIMKEDDVRIITDLMMGGTGDNNSEPISDLHLSAIGEAMNQMIGSSSTSLSTMFNKRIDILPPQAFILYFQNFSELDQFNPDEMVVKIAFRMEIGNLIDSEIMQLIPINFAKDLVSNLINNMANVEEPILMEKPAAPQVQPEASEKPASQPKQSAKQNILNNRNNTAQDNEPVKREEQKMVNVQPVQYQTFESEQWSTEKESIELIMDVPLEITVELGRTKKLIKDILEFGPGTILELDKLAGEPVDILVNGKYIAKGEVVVIDESFGVRITDIVSASKRLSKIQ
ncbi:MAG: flagellar motor switch protein FliN [Clostridia bacterium BRH_c25]|nr:MAG: flagellar motor switch protein FliN [Clostridia bacterium BRH_c25]